VIWITGASSGIGEAFAIECARRGARVALSSRRVEPLTLLVNKINKDFSPSKLSNESGNLISDKSAPVPKAIAYPLDVTDTDCVLATANAIEDDMGRIDILVANAGVAEYVSINEFSAESYLSVMDINYGGLVRCIEAVLPKMRARRSGRIAGVASLAGFRGLPTSGAYGASKSAMIHFLESLRFQLEVIGLGVTVINPGFVKTPMTDKNDFQMPFLITTEQAAKYMADGLESGLDEISFPWFFSRLMKIARIIPFFIYEFLARKIWSRMEHGKE
jgi:NAD(P)-dependent dehydrogenase (short-subunit alcohol dehydrogenase family)